MKKKSYTTFAAIHLGSEMISMQIVEYRNMNKVKVIEQCNHRVKLGEETFKNKIIPFSMVSEICELLQGYRRLMTEYGVEEYSLQATTAVREALNQVFFLDQIYIKTGLKTKVVDMPQEIYTKYTAIRQTLRANDITGKDYGMLLMDISSGGLGITFVDDGNIKYQQNFHVGIIRIKEGFNRNQRNAIKFNRALSEYLESTMGPVREALRSADIRYLVLSGAETELLLQMLGLDTKAKVTRIKVEDFMNLFNKFHKLNLPQIIKVFNIKESVAELVLPTILLYEQLLALVTTKEIIITADRFIDGIQLLHIGTKTDKEYADELEREQLSLIRNIGEHYKYDARHAKQVERLALAMFDKLSKSHGMDSHCRMLLQATAILHDIGKYISMRSHSLYSYKLIMSTDILGFSDDDKKIVALASYYHANKLFENKNTVEEMRKEEIPLVAKIAALIRLADALDRSYKQKINVCKVSVKDGAMHIKAQSKADMTLEEWTFEGKAVFFEEVYGLKAILERVNE